MNNGSPELERKNFLKRYILIAEDDPEDQEFLQQAFDELKTDIRVVFVNNGKEALTHLSQAQDSDLPCLIVMDNSMPEMNGSEVLKELSQQSRFDYIPKFILTTAQSPKFIDANVHKNGNRFITKPHSYTKLKELVEELVSACSTV